MKRFIVLFAAAFLTVAGLAHGAEAATYPQGTVTNGDAFPLTFSFFPTGGAVNDQFTFTLSSTAANADLVVSYGVFNLGAVVGLFDSSLNPVSSTLVTLAPNVYEATFANLVAGASYTLLFAGIANVGGFYAGTATVTPIPGALLLFASALGGLGFVGYRRRKLSV
jgi:hypothetical protein